MDEKLRKSLTAIICGIVECTEPLDCDMAITCPYVIDGLPQIEQAFRDDGWIKVSELTRKEFLGLSLEKRREILGRQVYAIEAKLEPQQPAGNAQSLADRLEAIRIDCGKQCLDILEDVAFIMDELDRVRGITHHLAYWCKKCKKQHVDSQNLFKSHKNEMGKDSIGIIRIRKDTVMPVAYPTHFIGEQKFSSLYEYSEFMQKSGAEYYGKNLYENLEPRQPEGELVENPYPDAHYPGCQNEVFAHGSEAQRAHMIQQGWVKLPSKERATEICREVERLSVYEAMPSSKVAQELLRLLQEQKP